MKVIDLVFTIPINPVTKKNSSIPIKTKTGKLIIIPSKAYQKYERSVKEYMPPVGVPINYPVNVEAHYYIGRNSKYDLTNLHEALHDVLVKYNVLEDDNHRIIISTDGSRVSVDREFPRTEVVISHEEPDYNE